MGELVDNERFQQAQLNHVQESYRFDKKAYTLLVRIGCGDLSEVVLDHEVKPVSAFVDAGLAAWGDRVAEFRLPEPPKGVPLVSLTKLGERMVPYLKEVLGIEDKRKLWYRR